MTAWTSKENSSIGKWLHIIISALLAIYVFYILVLNVIYAYEKSAIRYSILVIPVFALVLFCAYKFNVPTFRFSLVLFLCAFIIKAFLAINVTTPPISDFGVFYNAAIDVINGKKSFDSIPYFATWAYQMGPVLYYAAIMKLFGTSLIPLKLVNCIFMAGTNVFIYLIAEKLSNAKAARFVSILYMLYPAPFFLVPALTNQHFAACMFLVGIWVIMQHNKSIYMKSIIAGVLMAMGNAVRPLGIVIIGAVIAFGIVESVRKKSLRNISAAILLVVIFSLSGTLLSQAVKHSGLNSQGLTNNFPLWKFVVGLNYETKGTYSFSDQQDIFRIRDVTLRDEIAKKIIIERLSVAPQKLIELFNEKHKIMWARFDSLEWGFSNKTANGWELKDRVKGIEIIVLSIEKMYYICMMLLLLIGVLRYICCQSQHEYWLLVSLILLCFLGAHIFIEIQVRYRYFAVIIMFILMSKGSEILFKNIKLKGTKV